MGVPPVTEAKAEPLQEPEQVTPVGVIATVMAGGEVTFTEAVAVQPPASVTVAVYTPVHWFTSEGDTAPVLHEIVYKGVPPFTMVEIVELHCPEQLIGVALSDKVIVLGCVSTRVCVLIQPCESFIMSV